MTETNPSEADRDPQEAQHEAQPPEQQAGLAEPEEPVKPSVFGFPKKKQVITILLVGETGSGKTSFLSLLLNMLQGNGPFELEQLHDENAESGLKKIQSQTTEARLYTLTTSEGVKFQIVDTPGLADTRGVDENNKHRIRIYNAVKELVSRIDGVMLVVNGRNERLSVATSYTMETLATLFPRSIKDNIGILFTNVCPDERGLNFQIESLPPDLQTARYWCLDNPLSFYKKHLATMREAKDEERERSSQARNLKRDYDDTVQVLNNWLGWLDNREAMPTKAIIELFHKATEIESRLFGTTLSIENLSRLRKELQAIIRDLNEVEKKQKSLADVQGREPPKIWELVETSDYNTICLSLDCHSNCHPECDLELSDPKDLGGWCKVFKTLGVPNRLIPFKSDSSVKCSMCKHEASEHRNYRRLYKEQPSQVYQKALQELRNAQTSEADLRAAKDRIEEEIKRIEGNIEESKQDILHLVDEMNSISLSPNYAAYIRSAIQLFEMRKKQLESRADSDGELSVVEKGILAFKGHLDLLKDATVNQASKSYERVKRVFQGS